MPYIDGGTLQEHLTQTGQQKQPLPALRALTLARQIASALQATHLAGIILYELLAGTRPFAGSDRLAAERSDAPPWLAHTADCSKIPTNGEPYKKNR